MKKYLIGFLCLAAPIVHVQAADIIVDDFSDGEVEIAGRLFIWTFDGGWYGPNGYADGGNTAWEISQGKMRNTSAVGGSGPTALPAESGLFQIVTYGADPNPAVEISFDYDLPPGDTLFVHFWGIDGTVESTLWIANNQVTDGALVVERDRFTGAEVHNMKTGAPATGQAADAYKMLTGSGTYREKINVPDLNIPGVNTAGDFEYYCIAFCQNKESGTQPTVIDNVSITSSETPGYLDLILYSK